MANNRLEYSVDVRDLRIDFFRGLALYMILVDHIYADPISRFTYQNFGFSDAAEIFVFLSGVSCGIVYSRVLVRRGWTGLMAAITRRAALIYGYYVLSSLAIILLLKAATGSIKNAGVIDRSFLVLREDPFSAIWSTIFLISPPDLPGILVLYLVLTLIVIPLFLMGAARSAALTLAASGFIWTISQFYPELAPRLADHSYFNPLAWQFLFSIGMFLGLRHNLDWSGLRSTQIFKWLLVAAWVIVIGSFLYRFSFILSSRFQLDLRLVRISKIFATYASYERKSICRPPLAFPERCSSRGDLCYVKQSHSPMARRRCRRSSWQVFARNFFHVGNSQRGPRYNRRRRPPFCSRKTCSGWRRNTIDGANRGRID